MEPTHECRTNTGAAEGADGHGHAGHRHDHGFAALAKAGATRVLDIALATNSVLLVAQVAIGLLAGSLSVLADSVHQATDVVALALARVAVSLAARPAGRRYTYGYRQIEVLVAGANALLLAVSAVWLGVEAFERFGSTHDLDGGLVTFIGVVGLVVNGASAIWISRAAGDSLNLRAAGWHLATDAAGSAGVIVVGAAALAGSDLAARTLDPLIAAAIASMALWAAVRLARGVSRHLLHGVPDGIDMDAIEATLGGHRDVIDVHHLHIWPIGDTEVALSAHLVVGEEADLHEARSTIDELTRDLAHLGVSHPTLQVECHTCE